MFLFVISAYEELEWIPEVFCLNNFSRGAQTHREIEDRAQFSFKDFQVGADRVRFQTKV